MTLSTSEPAPQTAGEVMGKLMGAGTGRPRKSRLAQAESLYGVVRAEALISPAHNHAKPQSPIRT